MQINLPISKPHTHAHRKSKWGSLLISMCRISTVPQEHHSSKKTYHNVSYSSWQQGHLNNQLRMLLCLHSSGNSSQSHCVCLCARVTQTNMKHCGRF